MTIIQRLIAERKRRGLSVYRVAYMSGITAANIARTEKGISSMSLNNLEKWADALDLEIVVTDKKPARE